MSTDKLIHLAAFLSDRLEDPKTKQLSLYYSSFYWRIKGHLDNAADCLLSYLENDPSSMLA